MTLPPLATMLVGSYTKPGWLFNKEAMLRRDWEATWASAPEVRQQAWDDATRLAIYEQERAGLDVIGDGEQRRTSFVNYFYTFNGLDTEQLGTVQFRDDLEKGFFDLGPQSQINRPAGQQAPRVVGPVSWKQPMSLDDLRFLKRHTRRPVKMTVIGPVTAAARLADDYYHDDEALTLAIADVINAELRALDAEGIDIVQIDEPDIHMRRGRTIGFAAEAVSRAVAGLRAQSAVHICYGYSIAMKNKRVDPHFAQVVEAMASSAIDIINIEYEEPGHNAELLQYCGDKIAAIGILNLGDETVESADHVADRIREALTVVPAERLMLSPDCGMWFLPRPVAYAKMRAMALGAEIVRNEL